MRTRRFEAMLNLPFVIHALELGWQHDESNRRAHTWFYFHRPDFPRVGVMFQPNMGPHLYTVGHETTNGEAQAIQYLDQAERN